MKKASILVISGFCALGMAWSQTNIAKENQPSVVCVKTAGNDSSAGLGSGFFVEEDMVATNWHVVNEAQKIEVHTSDGKKCVAKLWVASPQHDLALLKLEEPYGKGRLVKIRSSSAQELETIYVCGHPEELAFSWSSGTIANSKRTLPSEIQGAPLCALIQLNAAISKGSSGGPMFDAAGNLLGVITGRWERGQNLNFAVHAEYLLELLKKGENIDSKWKNIRESKEWKTWRKTMTTDADWEEKANAAAAVINVHGPLVMIYVDLGTAAYKEGKWDIAQSYFDRATHYEPENSRAWIGKGLIDLKAKNKKVATESFQKALEFGEEDEEATLTACQGLERAGESDLAFEALKKSVERKPNWQKAKNALFKTKKTQSKR